MMVLWWFLDEFTNKAGDPMGVIIQKRMAAIFTQPPTSLQQLTAIIHFMLTVSFCLPMHAKPYMHSKHGSSHIRQDLVPDEFVMEHFTFGMMLGKDGKPFKTRTGGTVKLADLLDEAIERATTLIEQKSRS